MDDSARWRCHIRETTGGKLNTIAHICAMISVLYLATYSFETLEIEPLGFACVGLMLLYLVLTISAIADDWAILEGWSGKRPRG